MALKDKKLPRGTAYVKFSDFADGEVVTFNDVHIKEDGRYGKEVGLVKDNQILRLPQRYNDFIQEIKDNAADYAELKSGVDFVIKHNVSATGKVYGDISFA